MLADTCAGCHGTDGASAGPASPIIAGMNAECFVDMMEGFRDDSIYSTIMGRIAKGYTDDEIEKPWRNSSTPRSSSPPSRSTTRR